MPRLLRLAACALLCSSSPVFAQPSQQLSARIAAIATEAQGKVAVDCLLPGAPLDCAVDAQAHSPMQSVFKLPLAMTVLHRIDRGTFFPEAKHEPVAAALDRTVSFLPEDRIPGTFSPLQDAHPEADVAVTVRDLITLSAGRSDNAATEVLLRLVGGPSVVQTYIRSLGIDAFQLQDGEHGLDRDRTAQYRNWITPHDAVKLLHRFATDSPLSTDATSFLNQVLTLSASTTQRLRAGLPPGTVLAHKSGTSGRHGGVSEATNDIGLITLPDGRRLAVAVFITDARAEPAVLESVIARIGRAIYDESLIKR